MFDFLTNPLVFAGVCAVLSMILCYGDKCIFKYETDSNTYYIKIAILVFLLVLFSIHGYKFLLNYNMVQERSNLKTSNPEF